MSSRVNHILLIVHSMLTYYPLPTYGEMEQYTHLELSKRPYMYQKGLYKQVARVKDEIRINAKIKRWYTLKVVV